MSEEDQLPELLTPAEVANIFRVDKKTVIKWSNNGKIQCIRTPGNHRRYTKESVKSFFEDNRNKILEKDERDTGFDDFLE